MGASQVAPSLKNATELVGELVDTVAKGGNLLLNVPPLADGSFDSRVEGTLLSIGEWLATNGAGVYGSVPWDVCCEGPTGIVPGFNHEFPMFTATDFRFTAAKDGAAIFVFAMAPAASYKVSMLNYANAANVTSVSLVGGENVLQWTLEDGGLSIDCPECATATAKGDSVCEDCARTFRLHLGGSTAQEIDRPTAELRRRIREP